MKDSDSDTEMSAEQALKNYIVNTNQLVRHGWGGMYTSLSEVKLANVTSILVHE